MLRSCYRFQVTCNDVKHTSLLWSILPFFFHSPVLFHQKWTEMIDTGYRDPWGATQDFPQPRIQNSKTGNCFPTCQCGFTDIVTGLILLSHLLHIYCGNCKGKSVFYVQYVCTEPCVVMLLVLRGQVTTHSLLCCDLQLWFAEACCFISLSQSKYHPHWTTVIISPLTLRRSQARALAEYLPLEPCSPPLAGSACHVFCMVQSEQARCRPSRCADMQQVSTCVFCVLVADSPRWNSELCAPLSESQWRAREGGKKGLQRWSNHNKICPSLQKMDVPLLESLIKF